jgi:signal transduction histidine kinase
MKALLSRFHRRAASAATPVPGDTQPAAILDSQGNVVWSNAEAQADGAAAIRSAVQRGGAAVISLGGPLAGHTLVLPQAERRLGALKREMIGKLLGSLAHELNNPLGSIRLNCDLIAMELEDPAAAGPAIAEALSTIRESVTRVRDTVRSLRAISVTASPNDRRAVRLDLAARAALDSCRSMAQQLGVETRLAAGAEAVFCWVHPGQLGNALAQLVQNAISAAAESDRKYVEVRVDAVEGHARCAVEDGGAAIPESIRARLFDPLLSAKRGGIALGLGLCLAKSVAEANGGELQLESRPGAPVRFLLELPIPQGAEAVHAA